VALLPELEAKCCFRQIQFRLGFLREFISLCVIAQYIKEDEGINNKLWADILLDIRRYCGTCYTVFNPLTPNDLKRRRAVSHIKIKIPRKICVKDQQIHQLFNQFINYVW
jgi:ribosomal protein L31E